MIRVRLATADDQGDLIEFIRNHWSATHIFTQEPAVFEWQYRQGDGRLNMMLAEEVADDERSVLGVLGFIPMGRFDPSLRDIDITLAIWKVRDGSPPGLGLRLLKQIDKELRPRMIAAIGISDIVRPIYEVLKYEVAELEHCALFNPTRRDALRIARHVPAWAFEHDGSASGDVHLIQLTRDAAEHDRTAVDRLAHASRPEKSWEYVVQRYFTHPWYRYVVSLVLQDDRAVAVVVWRSVEAEGTRVLRIVDVIGSDEWFAGARSALLEQVIAADAEYVDVMHWGVEPGVLDAGGFVGRRLAPEIVIPNYFSPFERRNIDIGLACKIGEPDRAGEFRLYRADSDQDRPNTPADLELPRPG